MMTINLIDRLASEAKPVEPFALRRHLATGLVAGGAASLALVLAIYGVQPGLDTFAHGAPLAMKAAYAVTLGGIALALAAALSRPGDDARGWGLLLAPAVALAALAAWQLSAAPMARWPALMLGGTWDRCPWRIALLSLPVMVGLVLAVRREAPVHLRRAGAAIGLLSGATAATLYALACPEDSAAFVLVWYSLGIALATGIGALLGPRVLRW